MMNNTLSNFTYVLALLACVTAQVSAQELPSGPALLQASTERIYGPHQAAPVKLVQQILAQADVNEIDNLRACIRGDFDDAQAAQGLRVWRAADFKKAQKYFVIQALPSGWDQRQWYVLRPALKPYCQAFYGAHIFQYWLVKADEPGPARVENVKRWTLLQQSSADALALHRHQANWLLAETHCSASACRSGWYALSSTGLNLRLCSENSVDTRGEQVVPCR